VKHGLEIARWAFWSPEAREPHRWRERWAKPAATAAPQSTIPDDAIPAAHRRRMSPLSKLAVQIAKEATGDSPADFLVFCSQHGDLTRLREMLRDIAAGVPLSPTAFSQSVHNANAGLYTIISATRAPAISLASGGTTFASGWLEAEGFLVEHPQAQVLLVCYDEPLPHEYLPYSTRMQCHYAVAMMLRLAARGGLTLRTGRAEQDEPLPMAPLFIAWALSDTPTLRITADGQAFIWTREDPSSPVR
jgi:hypothetical protein